MADFCKECSIDMFGEPGSDFTDLISEGEVMQGKFLPVICEGCGFIGVDHEGYRVTKREREHEYATTKWEIREDLPEKYKKVFNKQVTG